jgi:hypothetical protein
VTVKIDFLESFLTSSGSDGLTVDSEGFDELQQPGNSRTKLETFSAGYLSDCRNALARRSIDASWDDLGRKREGAGSGADRTSDATSSCLGIPYVLAYLDCWKEYEANRFL